MNRFKLSLTKFKRLFNTKIKSFGSIRACSMIISSLKFMICSSILK